MENVGLSKKRFYYLYGARMTKTQFEQECCHIFFGKCFNKPQEHIIPVVELLTRIHPGINYSGCTFVEYNIKNNYLGLSYGSNRIGLESDYANPSGLACLFSGLRTGTNQMTESSYRENSMVSVFME